MYKKLHLPKIEALPELLIKPERFQEAQPIAELAVVRTMYPDLPEAAIYYFPEQPGDQGA